MSGFSAEWLALREPVDHAAIHADLRREFCRALSQRKSTPTRIVEIGCGTGSNVRGLSAWLAGQDIHWTLVDIDPSLLNEAERRLRGDGHRVETRCLDLASADLDALFAAADAVTSAAFFDLASQGVVDRIAGAARAVRAILYTVLIYDGIAAWLPEHPADASMREAFNAHQTGDKGMGPALGPSATTALATAFTDRGYTVRTGPSPWVVDTAHAEMRAALDDGWASAVDETRQVDRDLVASWQTHRRLARDAVTLVGHQDLLAIPD